MICVDKESEDGTQAVVKEMDAKLIVTASNLRSQRLNLGFSQAAGKILLFHHPRSCLTTQALDHLLAQSEHLGWGGFTHSFDQRHPILEFTSWYSNSVRPRSQGVVYLDHCIFARRSLLEMLELPLWPEVDIFEDTLFSKRLAKLSRPTILPYKVVTSAVRFKTHGIARQAAMNQLLKLGYFMGVDKEKMNRWYEQSINLNSKYK